MGNRERITIIIVIIKLFKISVKKGAILTIKVDVHLCTGEETHDNIDFVWLRKVTMWSFQRDTCHICFCQQDLEYEQNIHSHFPPGCDMLDQPRMWAHLQYDYSRQEFSPLLHDLINWMSGRGLERNLTVCKYGWGWGRGEGGTQRAALGCQSHHYAEADLTRCLGEVWFSNRLVLKSECYKCYSLYNWGKDITHRKWLQFSIFWAPVTKETLTKWLKEISLRSSGSLVIELHAPHSLLLTAIASTKWTVLETQRTCPYAWDCLFTVEVDIIHPHFSNKEIESYSLAGKKEKDSNPGLRSWRSSFVVLLLCQCHSA